ncbi:hypothetical protein AB0368_09565 [Actinoplanes sp. NPDC051475]|uniref:hypothetical protein n=1 Tax=Actinoplanes sp. NPDC051475 TaxID=3157225 RepID=UPI00344C1E09
MRADDPSRESNAFTISGTLQGGDEHGDNVKTLARKRFAVSLDPSNAMLLATEGSDDSVATILDLGATETDGAGKFTVQIPALRDIDNYVEEDGSVGLLFQGLDDGFELMWRTPVHLPHGGEKQATAAVPDEKVYKKSLGTKTTVLPPDKVTADGELDLSGPVPDVPSVPVAVSDLTLTGLVTSGTADAASSATRESVAAADVGSGEKAKACRAAMGNTPWDSYGWTKKGPVYREWVPVQRAQTGDKTKMKYEWSNTKENSVDILAKLGYSGSGGTAISAGSSKSVKVGSGLTFNVGHDVVRDLDAEYDFATYTLRCKVSGSDIYRDSKLTKVQMYQFKGFSRTNHYTGYYTCPNPSYKGPIPAELWVSRDSTSAFSFTLGANGSYRGVGADVGLTSKQTNTTSHKKTYIEVKPGAVLCGQNGNPTRTEKVSETS